jgi:RNA polymerase sigma-70 factor, ECF subfamily
VQRQSEIEASFIAKINKHQGIIHKICYVYSNNSIDNEDLYQEVVLQLWKSYPSFKGKSEFSTWMYRVALNTVISLTKKPSLFVSQSKAPTTFYDIEKSMDFSEDVKILYQAISRLKKVEKAIILLWLEEKSYDEISDTIGISVKNVSVKLVRIKNKLAEIIEKLQ